MKRLDAEWLSVFHFFHPRLLRAGLWTTAHQRRYDELLEKRFG